MLRKSSLSKISVVAALAATLAMPVFAYARGGGGHMGGMGHMGSMGYMGPRGGMRSFGPVGWLFPHHHFRHHG
jgi:hypothetical protein